MKVPHLRNPADYIYLNVHQLYLKHAVDFTTNTDVIEIYFVGKKNECIVHPKMNIIYSNYFKPVEFLCSVQNKMIF